MEADPLPEAQGPLQDEEEPHAEEVQLVIFEKLQQTLVEERWELDKFEEFAIALV